MGGNMLLELVQSEIIFENKDKNLKLAENIIKSSNLGNVLSPMRERWIY